MFKFKLGKYNILFLMLLISLLAGMTAFYYNSLFAKPFGPVKNEPFQYTNPIDKKPDIKKMAEETRIASTTKTAKSSTMLNIKEDFSKGIELPILMYHYIEPINTKDKLRASMTISPESFEKHLELISKSNFTTITIAEVESKLSNTNTKEKLIALTFDDGYRDLYEYAFPLLKKYNLKATVYVIYDAINAPDYLTEDMIKEMMASGLIEIGSHTLDHKKLDAISKLEAKRQISLSKKMFEKRFKTPMITFAYPYGAFNQVTADFVKEAGYKAAVSVISGEKQSESNRFFMFRLRPNNGTTLIEHLLSK